ncbi:PQQ-dependent sugar dehydrogenase [Altererythrobacter sp. CAU 1778]
MALASCGTAATGESVQSASDGDFAITEHGSLEEPWAIKFVPGTSVAVVTLKAGEIRGIDTQSSDRAIAFTGAPDVDYGGQGGLGDVAFLESEAAGTLTPRTIFLSWVEAGENDTRGAVVGKGQMVCEEQQSCEIRGLNVIWRQDPKVTGRGHFSHRLAVSPDEQYLFVASGERQKMQPAQDTSNNLGSIVRLTLDGTPAADGAVSGNEEIWSYGHRNILGLRFDPQGRLWDLEHGPAGGDELNLVKPGANYGWPVVSDGDHYDGAKIPNHDTRPEFEKYKVNWTPVIAPGDMIFYTGGLFGGWQGDLLIPGLKTEALIRVEMNGDTAREAARYPMKARLRSIAQAPDGAVWVVEDGESALLLRLAPQE